MKTALALAWCLAAALPAQQAGPALRDAKVVAMDHLESKGVTAWIVDSPAGERVLMIARLGAPAITRLRGRPMRDVVIDASARSVFTLVARGGAFALEQVTLDGDAMPRVLASDLAMSAPLFGRAGEDVFLLTREALLAVTKGGEVTPLFRREDPGISAVAINDRRSLLATARAGDIELVSADGRLLANLGPGRAPAFVESGELTFVRDWPDPPAPGSLESRRSSEIVLADTAALEVFGRPLVALSGAITRLRPAGDGTLLFRHASGRDDERDWILHLGTGVVRPMGPKDRGALRAAANQSASRPAVVADPAGIALPEPEAASSGFFVLDENGREYRTAYEASGWDDVLNPDEARLHRRLLDQFLEGVQWPFRSEGAYQPFLASDDEPLRAFSAVPHRGLDLGARLMHTSTGSVAFHAPGTPVYPLYRGGHVWFGVAATVRDAGPQGAATANRRYPILQEVELREWGYLLRVHIAYEHVRAAHDDPDAPQASEDPFPVTGDEPIGELEAFSHAAPTGGWITSDPSLRAAGIEKGNHVHVGTGGIYRSFNEAPEGAARKLQWYRERLLPQLKRSRGPK